MVKGLAKVNEETPMQEEEVVSDARKSGSAPQQVEQEEPEQYLSFFQILCQYVSTTV